MSNEYKDWVAEKMQDVVLDRGLADKVEWPKGTIIDGIKNGQPVKYKVWFDTDLGEWRVEHRELDI